MFILFLFMFEIGDTQGNNERSFDFRFFHTLTAVKRNLRVLHLSSLLFSKIYQLKILLVNIGYLSQTRYDRKLK